MKILLNIIAIYYVIVFFLIGMAGTLSILMEEYVFDIDNVFSDINDFICCILMYQVSVYEYLKDDINMCGIIILEIFTTFSVWFLNIIVLAMLCLVLVIKSMCHCFYVVFRKKPNEHG